MKPTLLLTGCAACWLLSGPLAPAPPLAWAQQAPAKQAKPAPRPDAPPAAAKNSKAAQPAGTTRTEAGKAEAPGGAARPGQDTGPGPGAPPPQPAAKGGAGAGAAAPPMEVVAGRPGGPGSPRVTLPLAPTREELERRQQAADAAQAQTDQGRPPPRESLRRVPTQTGNTAGPGSRAGAGTLHDRKASTLEMTGPTHGVRR